MLFLDGAMGTEIQNYKLTESDYRGARFADITNDVKGNNDLLVLKQPDIISAIHKSYLEAGADIIETNSFNGTQISMADYRMEHLAYEINKQAAHLARLACDEYNSKPQISQGLWRAGLVRHLAPVLSRQMLMTLPFVMLPSMSLWIITPNLPWH